MYQCAWGLCWTMMTPGWNKWRYHLLKLFSADDRWKNVWNTGGMIPMGTDWSTGRITCLSATLSTTNLTHSHGIESRFHCGQVVTKCARLGMTLNCSRNYVYFLIHITCTVDHTFLKKCWSSNTLGLVSPSCVCAFYILHDRSENPVP
jgi:hypothetical protein